MRPLQIYLDSADFSDLSESNKPDHLNSIEEKLLSWQELGFIEMRFSYIHVIEASPLRKEDIELARNRIDKISQLCGKKCFASTIEILERECSNTGEFNLQSYSEWLYRNDGQWVPPIDGIDVESLSATALLRNEISNAGHDRSTRRKLQRTFFDPQGRLRTAGKAKLREGRASVVREIEDRYPLPPGAAEKLALALETGAQQSELRELVRSSVSDLRYWPQWFLKQWEKITPMCSLLRTGANQLNSDLLKHSEDIRNAYREAIADGLPHEKLEQFFRREFDKEILNMQRTIVARMSENPVSPSSLQTKMSPWETAPGMTCALTVQSRIARRQLVLSGKGRPPDEGDFGDALHCAHFPFVDLFRADGFTASMISEAKLHNHFKVKVVPKLTQLPDAIENSLKESGRI
ncbi:hypothetical protein [Rhodocyclus tenuis]|uniref:Uncharacterized protein n=1 Tax=Rhodocyclus tenuis TaxID=1066 RepID=A0A840GJ02_RHOTE|nr:hypothetical protein [Rhodocyclus tenuis]MBB4248432.1 hypothetical protein [Rhodocyclus tenuis]